MTSGSKELPGDATQLKQLLLEERARNAALEEQNELLRRELFGRRSEKLAPGEELQALLFNEAEVHGTDAEVEPVNLTPVKSHRRKKRGRKPISEDLPRREIVHDVPEADRSCACGSDLTHIGDDVTEELEIIPQQVVVNRHVRRKYACRACEGSADESRPAVRTAPLPRLLPGSMAGAGLLAHVLISKFCDALPFYRQEKMFERLGVQISRATMCNWTMAIARRLSRLRELMCAEVRAGPCVGIDETTVQVLREPGRAASTKSYMWVMRGGEREHPVVTYEYRATRSGKFLRERLANYEGAIMSDGFTGYEWLNNVPGITIGACWAHARRGFHKAHKLAPASEGPRAALELIRKMYRIEKDLRGRAVSKIRKGRYDTKIILAELKEFLERESLVVVPGGQYGKAIAYTLDLWDRLAAFVDSGTMPIDNNDVENAIRPFVIGRKNWMFFDTQNGADAGALIYSLIETAKANGHEPYWYLRYLFEVFPTTAATDEALRELLPHRVTFAQIERELGTPQRTK